MKIVWLFLVSIVFTFQADGYESEILKSDSGHFTVRYSPTSTVSLDELLKKEKNGGLKHIRFLCCMSAQTFVAEITGYYQRNIPKELEKALKSSGNLHNPALLPLSIHFKEALKTTSEYKLIRKTLIRHKYEIKSIWVEKFTYKKNDIHADINFVVIHVPNKTLKSDS